MSLGKLVSKYIASAELAFKELEIAPEPKNLDGDCVRKVVEHARNYLTDAKHYRDKMELEVSLTSVAYCEGLLDALRLLGALRFEWQTKKKGLRTKRY